ncbi:MAG: hypothetical protein IT361_01620 [Gemmatimonadaceae bacterium]|nr:hypothetical protein [Gemmatimonadaceae bacterium]
MPRLLPAVLIVATVACARGESPTTDSSVAAVPPASPNVVTIVARDFAFEAPDTIPAGMTTLQLVNAGPDLHHALLLRIGEGKTLADFTAAVQGMKPGEPPPSWLIDEGGPNPPAVGDTVRVTQDLAPGNYALVCFVDTPDHIPHVAKGMVRPLTVRANTTPSAPPPTEDVKVVMTDYAWAVTPALSAGRHVLRFDNAAAQSHEVLIVRLDAGKTVDDFAK